jgi:hypothetical protein
MNITLIGPVGTTVLTALIDTGADDCVFPARAAQIIGLDLTAAPSRTVTRVSGPAVLVAYAQITFRATDGIEFRE